MVFTPLENSEIPNFFAAFVDSQAKASHLIVENDSISSISLEGLSVLLGEMSIGGFFWMRHVLISSEAMLRQLYCHINSTR